MTDVLEKGKAVSGSGSGSYEEDSDGVYEDEYYVEKIIDKRYNEAKGRSEYFIKWRGWPEESNTWEPVEHLENCPEILEKFERSRGEGAASKKKANSKKVKGRRGEPPKIKFDFSKNKKRTLSINDLNDTDDIVGGQSQGSTSTGFDRGLEPERVHYVSRSEVNGELVIWMKWKGVREPEEVPARIANEMCPQIVIRFYQNNILWGTKEEEDPEPECCIQLLSS